MIAVGMIKNEQRKTSRKEEMRKMASEGSEKPQKEGPDGEASSDECDEADSLCNNNSQAPAESHHDSSKNFSTQAVRNIQDDTSDNDKQYQEKEVFEKEKSTTNSIVSSDF